MISRLLKYLAKILVKILSYYKTAFLIAYNRYIDVFTAFKADTYIKNIFEFSFNILWQILFYQSYLSDYWWLGYLNWYRTFR